MKYSSDLLLLPIDEMMSRASDAKTWVAYGMYRKEHGNIGLTSSLDLNT